MKSIIIDELFGNKKHIEQDDFSQWFDQKLRFALSQNAVLEMGHLWKAISFDKIRFVPVFKKNDFTFKFPSDIPSQFLFYYNNNFYDFIDNLIRVVLRITPNANVLNDANYKVDYTNLFTANELDVIDSPRKEVAKQFKAIDQLWTAQVSTLKQDYERLIFVYERIVFLSYFPRKGEVCDHWLNNAIESIDDKKSLYYKILLYIRKYIYHMQRQGTAEEIYFDEHREIADNLFLLKKKLEELSVNVNPLVEIHLNDYIGLASRWTVYYFDKLKNRPVFDRDEYLKRSVDSLNRCADIEASFINEASSLWSGYSVYNIARTYAVMGDNDKSDKKMREAYFIREKWRRMDLLNKLPRVFSHPIKAEIVPTGIYAIRQGCFNDDNAKGILNTCKEIIDELINIPLEPIGVVENARKVYDKYIEDMKTTSSQL